MSLCMVYGCQLDLISLAGNAYHTSWYITVLPTDISICREVPWPLPSVARVTAVVVSALQFIEALQVKQMLVRVGGVPRLTGDTRLRHIDGTLIPTSCTTVTVT